ncbi:MULTISPECIES: EDSAP-1 family PEP-CTERM protein [unclassified Janthinobacterium]|uniref:EDSAP-1 family PEP-CTERM protein n=1 Tax=unclassified Janthinobacterium TaxID=2610881 RepID=UPI0016180CA1|nr:MULTISPECIES: EDSAP-1 family PEP-CTERM protein [unclassified Janthinobacterium]MBB5607044.1 hypothetical protein [Janthinobacterium sp. S3T4]MBB5612770.1 hypothetical protein [Janthinobacterium sp. S3M3]
MKAALATVWTAVRPKDRAQTLLTGKQTTRGIPNETASTQTAPGSSCTGHAGCRRQRQAGAYGYSYDNIFGLVITNPTGSITVASSSNISRGTATLNGASVIRGGSGISDTPQAALGTVTKGENDFSQQGASGIYSRGDSQIVSTQFPSFPPGAASTQAVNVAEAHLADAGSADASGRNGSNTGFSVNFVVGSPSATLAFNFLAHPFMQVFLNSDIGIGSSSTANLVFSFTITDAAGHTMFNWAQDHRLKRQATGTRRTPRSPGLAFNGALSAFFTPAPSAPQKTEPCIS